MKDYNKTYGDRFVKTTINLRKSMMVKVHQRMDELHKEDLIDYLRDLISMDLRHKIIGSMEDISLNRFRTEVGWVPKDHHADQLWSTGHSPAPGAYSPPRKYSGFVAGLLRSPYVLRWFNGQRESLLPGTFRKKTKIA